MRYLALLTGLVILLRTSSAQATLIAAWDFNTYDGNATTISSSNSPYGGVNGGTITIKSTGTPSFDSAELNAGTGGSPNLVSGDTAGSSIQLLNGTTNNNGAWLDITFSLTGYEDLVLTYATRKNASQGFASNQWSYSINGGTNFTNIAATAGTGVNVDGTVNPPISTSVYTVITVNFSAISSLDNLATVVLRYTFGGGNTGGGHTDKYNELDNLQLNATAITAPPPVVPEPSSLALAGWVVVGLAALSRRRKAAGQWRVTA